MPDSTLRRRMDQLGQNTALDRFVEPLSRAVRSALRDQRTADALHGVWLGHPLHPALTDLPIGAWTSAGLMDLTGTNPRTAAALVGVGVVTAVPTATAGLADWSRLHKDQQRVGLVHAAANVLGTALYTASLVNRMRGRRGMGRLLGFLGYATVMGGAALGGHLAFRLAAGPNHAERVPWVAPEGWQDVCSLDELPERRPVRHQIGELSVLVVRSGTEIYALSGECAHLDGPLYDGELTGWDTEPCVTCPWHGSTYRLRDGQVVHGPATAPQPAIEVRVESGRVLLRAPSDALAGVTEPAMT